MPNSPAFPADSSEFSYLARVGDRVRAARKRLRMSRRALAELSDISERYLAELEAGNANISLLLLRQIAEAINLRAEYLVADSDPESLSLIADMGQATSAERRHLADVLAGMRRQSTSAPRARRMALIGLRGAGKSTLGRLVGAAMDVPFVELNREIEAECGLSLPEIFSLYGEPGYRRLEKRCIEAVAGRHELVILAVAGGIVAEPVNYQVLLDGFHTVWLRASPEEHMERVRAQGDERPMAGNPAAMDELRAILETRERAYARADAELTTSGKTEAESAATLEMMIKAVLGKTLFA